jgi:hypothetical protein
VLVVRWCSRACSAPSAHGVVRASSRLAALYPREQLKFADDELVAAAARLHRAWGRDLERGRLRGTTLPAFATVDPHGPPRWQLMGPARDIVKPHTTWWKVSCFAVKARHTISRCSLAATHATQPRPCRQLTRLIRALILGRRIPVAPSSLFKAHLPFTCRAVLSLLHWSTFRFIV